MEEETSTAVVLAVAEITGVDALKLSPLYEVLDPDALNRAFADDQGSYRWGEAQITFPFGNCWITVRSDDQIIVVPREELNVSPSLSYCEMCPAKHDWTSVSSLSTTLLKALNEVSQQCDLMSPEPFTTIINFDSLDRLFAPIDQRSQRDAGWLSVSVDGYAITVEASGQIKFAPASRSPAEGRI
ncbi:HalOD1 output domain-containing protein [Haloarcula laminariae]|uniref:HalOD1 output domain-containing protein n=1 Tax=Haloarcula laminariae TaxID=2961577 RepID=UPI00240612BC|nr:HalOD1 output domain-containing protein [Halomicroarcula sp. FL173]